MSQSAMSTAAMAWMAAPRRPYQRVASYMSCQRASGASGSLPVSTGANPCRKGIERGASTIARMTEALETASPWPMMPASVPTRTQQHLLGSIGLELDLWNPQVERLGAGDFHGRSGRLRFRTSEGKQVGGDFDASA